MESQLRLTVVLGFWHSLYTIPEIIVPNSGVHLSDTFRYILLLVRRGSELFGVSVQTDSGIRIFGIPDIPCQKLYVLISDVHLSNTFRDFLLLVRRGSELFGVSALNRMTMVLGFWHSLYTVPEIIVPISGVYLF